MKKKQLEITPAAWDALTQVLTRLMQVSGQTFEPCAQYLKGKPCRPTDDMISVIPDDLERRCIKEVLAELRKPEAKTKQRRRR